MIQIFSRPAEAGLSISRGSYPALTPQRASAPRRSAGLFSFVPSGLDLACLQQFHKILGSWSFARRRGRSHSLLSPLRHDWSSYL